MSMAEHTMPTGNTSCVRAAKASPMGVIVAAILGVLCALVFGALYGFLGTLSTRLLAVFYGQTSIKLLMIAANIFIAVCTAGVLGILVRLLGLLSKRRHSATLALLGLWVGTLAAYAAWVVWIYVSTQYQLLLYKPLDLLTAIAHLGTLYASPVFDVFKLTGATLLYSLWGLETLVIIGMTLVIGRKDIAGKPLAASRT